MDHVIRRERLHFASILCAENSATMGSSMIKPEESQDRAKVLKNSSIEGLKPSARNRSLTAMDAATV